MKLKYYLRGLSVGIILTVIIMMISFSMRKKTLSEEEIIQRAEALGMVMDDKNITEGEADDSQGTASEGADMAEPDQGEAKQEDVDSGKPISGEADTTGQEPGENQGEPEKEAPEPELVEFTILKGEFSDKISQRLFAAELIDDNILFNAYLVESEYDGRIVPGVHYIPKGATYQEIAEILCEKP